MQRATPSQSQRRGRPAPPTAPQARQPRTGSGSPSAGVRPEAATARPRGAGQDKAEREASHRQRGRAWRRPSTQPESMPERSAPPEARNAGAPPGGHDRQARGADGETAGGWVPPPGPQFARPPAGRTRTPSPGLYRSCTPASGRRASAPPPPPPFLPPSPLPPPLVFFPPLGDTRQLCAKMSVSSQPSRSSLARVGRNEKQASASSIRPSRKRRAVSLSRSACRWSTSEAAYSS